MSYYITFMVDREYVASNGIAPIFSDYSWWLDLIKNFLKKADTFEMRNWSDDIEAIESGLKYGKKTDNTVTEEIVFQGEITNHFKIEVLENFLSKEGFIKWFTINFYHDKKIIFSSSHYGDETCIFDLSEEEIYQTQEWAKQYQIIKRVNVFNQISSNILLNNDEIRVVTFTKSEVNDFINEISNIFDTKDK